MRTNVYVDGFNLYYGAVKDTPYKWLDVRKCCELAFPRNEIHEIHYCTAIVNSLKGQLRLERHLARTPGRLLRRIAARILALCAAIHLNWQLGRPRRALTAYGH